MKTKILPFITAGLSLLLVSCVNSGYYDRSCELYLNVRSSDGNNAQLSDVALYIYDVNNNLLGYHTSQADVAMNIEQYRSHGAIKAILWCNALGNPSAQTLSTPTVGSNFTTHNLTQNLSSVFFNSIPIISEPSDLFYGALNINFEDFRSTPSGNTKIALVDRFISSYILTVRHLGRTFDGPDADYKILIRHPNKGADFNGILTSGEVVYMPKTTYHAQIDELNSTISMALPTGSSTLTIEIYSGKKLIYSAQADTNYNPISLASNKLQNILIDFNRNGDVNLITGAWGEILIFEEFD